jgi:Ca2+-binding EF-hand superfamily protein
MRQELRSLLLVFSVLAMVVGVVNSVLAVSSKEVERVFRILDTNHDGKVSRAEYDVNKVHVIYLHSRHEPGEGLTFADVRVSKKFFEAADADHDGKLSPVEILDALPFEAVDTKNRGFFLLEDLRRYMNLIAR